MSSPTFNVEALESAGTVVSTFSKLALKDTGKSKVLIIDPVSVNDILAEQMNDYTSFLTLHGKEFDVEVSFEWVNESLTVSQTVTSFMDKAVQIASVPRSSGLGEAKLFCDVAINAARGSFEALSLSYNAAFFFVKTGEVGIACVNNVIFVSRSTYQSLCPPYPLRDHGIEVIGDAGFHRKRGRVILRFAFIFGLLALSAVAGYFKEDKSIGLAGIYSALEMFTYLLVPVAIIGAGQFESWAHMSRWLQGRVPIQSYEEYMSTFGLSADAALQSILLSKDGELFGRDNSACRFRGSTQLSLKGKVSTSNLHLGCKVLLEGDVCWDCRTGELWRTRTQDDGSKLITNVKASQEIDVLWECTEEFDIN